MKKDQVKIGETYRVKVSGSMADVKITAENPHGGWDGVNVLTNRRARIKSAQRLRGKTPLRPAKRQVVKSLDDLKYEEAAKAVPGRIARASADKPKIVTKAQYEAEAEARKKASKKASAKTDGKKRTSGLDAAAKVLAEAKQPLTAKEMVERVLAKGLWKTSGKTPAATIYAAIIREIAAKGGDARFKKVARGKFEAAK